MLEMGMRLVGKTGVEVGHIWRCLKFALDGLSLLPLQEARLCEVLNLHGIRGRPDRRLPVRLGPSA